jgi:hypothetical protein
MYTFVVLSTLGSQKAGYDPRRNLIISDDNLLGDEICKYASFSKVGGNYPLDLKIIWSSVHENCSNFNQKYRLFIVKY